MRNTKLLYTSIDPLGSIIGAAIIICWFLCLYFILDWEINYYNPAVYFAVLLQTHLYTGLFITAHDAMHGSVSKNRKINNTLGWATSLLFAFNFYDRLHTKHHEHHKFVATEKDPDYHESGKLWLWYINYQLKKKHTNT